MDFKTRIRELRKVSHITQEQLATRIGVTKQAISQYERGIRQPEYETLEALADFFNVDLDYLLGRSNKTTLLPQSGYYMNPAVDSGSVLSSEDSELLSDFHKLNTEGKAEARKQVRNLTKIEDYTKDTGSSASAAG